MRIKSEKGAITLFVLIAGLSFILFLTSMLVIGSVKRQAQIEANKQAKIHNSVWNPPLSPPTLWKSFDTESIEEQFKFPVYIVFLTTILKWPIIKEMMLMILNDTNNFMLE